MSNVKLLSAVIIFCSICSCIQQEKYTSVNLNIPEPSGLEYDAVENKLWTVSDETNCIYLLNRDGEILKRIELPDKDLEGIALVNDSTLAVLSEERRKIVFVSKNGSIIDRKSAFNNGIFNNGPEGIAYDRNNKTYWLANEKNPAMIIKYDSLFNEIERKEIDFVRDISGLCYDGTDNCLWMISDEDKKIFKLDMKMNIMESFDTNVIQMEGVAINHNDNVIYIISDREEKLYRFKIK
ncbi:SdiA-regulated domain-containing protein [Melioribacter sp. OK-6-Me]|uniref:SdiA-regulated domain-containing protein n=1 Tax=unclassified Melioribacter TaxID=2627329 RepID=UPI003ED8F451